MKAYVLHGIGDISFDDVQKPAPKENEVIVKVMAAGVCGSDIPRIYKTGAYSHPLIPGHEFSGQVVEIGADADEKWLGKRVGIFPLIPCKKCLPCRNESYEMCRSYSYLGSRRDGGFAEYAAVPQDNLIELPDNVTFEQAAMLEPMAVAVHSMRRADIKCDDTVVVAGIGTIGMFLIMFLQEMGVKKILAVGNKDFQRENVIKMGIPKENFCDIRTDDVSDFITERTESGADVYFECVGKNDTVTTAINNTAPSGTVMLVGNPYSDMMFEKNVYWKILRNQLTMLGTWNSSFTHNENDDWNYVLRKLTEKKITPEMFITHKLDFDNLIYGFEVMRDKAEEYGKIMVKSI